MDYVFQIICEHPHERYSRSFRLDHTPTPREIMDSIKKVRDKAKSDGIIEVVKIEAATVRAVKTTETNDGLLFTTEFQDRVL